MNAEPIEGVFGRHGVPPPGSPERLSPGRPGAVPRPTSPGTACPNFALPPPGKLGSWRQARHVPAPCGPAQKRSECEEHVLQ